MNRDAKVSQMKSSSDVCGEKINTKSYNEKLVSEDHLFNTHQIKNGLVNPIVDYLDVVDSTVTYRVDTRRLKQQGLNTKDIERPEFILFNNTKGFTVNEEVHRPAKDRGAFAVLTEHRLFVLVGREQKDLYWSIEYSPSIRISFSFGIFKHRLDIIDYRSEENLMHTFYINKSIERRVLNIVETSFHQRPAFDLPVVKRVRDSMRRSPPTALNTIHTTLFSSIQSILHEDERSLYTVHGLEARMSKNPDDEWPTISESKPSADTYITFTDSRLIIVRKDADSMDIINYDSLRRFRICKTISHVPKYSLKWNLAIQTDTVMLDFTPATMSMNESLAADASSLDDFIDSSMGLDADELRSTSAVEISDDVFQYDSYYWGRAHPMHSESDEGVSGQYSSADFSTFSNPELLNILHEIDPIDFEHFVADLWQRQGWKTKVTSASSDKGIDIVAEREAPFHEKQLIQAKKYGPENKVGSPEVQQYSSLRHQRAGVDAVIIVTTSSFSPQARDLAADLNVKLIDGDQLCDLIERVDGYDLYSDITST